MNYYEHHLGDYMRDTAHLTMLEDCAYRRLLDAYYIRERPLPVDLSECCKLARAASKPERDAVAYVLREFFSLAEDGYRQGRADDEIERYRVKRQKAADSANARWNASERNANAMRTHSEGNALQSPVPTLQSLNPKNPPTPRKRGERRCPDSFELTPELLALSAELPADFDLDGETRKFRDHEFQKARTDWPACWRSWMRNARDRKSYAKRAASAPTIRQPPTPEAISAAREAAARQNAAQLAKVMPRLA